MQKKRKRTLPFVAAPQLFKLRAAEAPDGKVIFHHDVTTYTAMSYQTLDQTSDHLANQLTAMGVNAGDETMVGICMQRGIQPIIAMLAIWKAGGTFVPLEFNNATALNYKLNDTKLNLVIGEETTSTSFDPTIRFIDINKPFEKKYQYPRDQNTDITATTRAYIMYTSGTTGDPKGVQMMHGALVKLWQASIERLFEGLAPEEAEVIINRDAAIINSPLTFDAFIQELFQALLTPRTHIVTEEHRLSNTIVGKLILEWQITILTSLATWLSGFNPTDLDPLRDIISMGAPPKEDLLYMLAMMKPGRALRNESGGTETGVRNFKNRNIYSPEKGWDKKRANSIGVPSFGTEILIVDQETLQPVLAGQTGELLIAGEVLARGYLNNETLTAQRFIYLDVAEEKNEMRKKLRKHTPERRRPQTHKKRYYRTGDLAVQDSDEGYVTLQGRADRQIKIHGGALRISLEAIEKVLSDYPGIDRAAVIAKQSGQMQYLVAYIQRMHDATVITTDELTTYLRGRGQAVIPTQFIFCPIPLTVNGKINSAQLPEPHTFVPTEILSPTRNHEEAVAQIWRRILGKDKAEIDIRTPLHLYNPDSLIRAMLEAMLNLHFKLAPPHAFTLTMLQEGGCDIFLMSTLKGNIPTKKYQLYLKRENNFIRYQLLGDNGNIIDSSIPRDALQISVEEFMELNNENIASFQKVRMKILDITSKRGHTQEYCTIQQQAQFIDKMLNAKAMTSQSTSIFENVGESTQLHRKGFSRGRCSSMIFRTQTATLPNPWYDEDLMKTVERKDLLLDLFPSSLLGRTGK